MSRFLTSGNPLFEMPMNEIYDIVIRYATVAYENGFTEIFVPNCVYHSILAPNEWALHSIQVRSILTDTTASISIRSLSKPVVYFRIHYLNDIHPDERPEILDGLKFSIPTITQDFTHPPIWYDSNCELITTVMLEYGGKCSIRFETGSFIREIVNGIYIADGYQYGLVSFATRHDTPLWLHNINEFADRPPTDKFIVGVDDIFQSYASGLVSLPSGTPVNESVRPTITGLSGCDDIEGTAASGMVKKDELTKMDTNECPECGGSGVKIEEDFVCMDCSYTTLNGE